MLETKRRVIGHLIVCQGCCCRETGKDRPAVVEWLKAVVEWLKEEWRRRGLLKLFQLSISRRVEP
jgi:hypothetical protein